MSKCDCVCPIVDECIAYFKHVCIMQIISPGCSTSAQTVDQTTLQIMTIVK